MLRQPGDARHSALASCLPAHATERRGDALAGPSQRHGPGGQGRSPVARPAAPTLTRTRTCMLQSSPRPALGRCCPSRRRATRSRRLAECCFRLRFPRRSWGVWAPCALANLPLVDSTGLANDRWSPADKRAVQNCRWTCASGKHVAVLASRRQRRTASAFASKDAGQLGQERRKLGVFASGSRQTAWIQSPNCWARIHEPVHAPK
eukprot:2710151-Rhodomonas_salina.1